MTKETKTTTELADMVEHVLGIDGLSITAAWDKIYDWNAFAMVVPEDVTDIHYKMQITVEELRKHYRVEPPNLTALNFNRR